MMEDDVGLPGIEVVLELGEDGSGKDESWLAIFQQDHQT